MRVIKSARRIAAGAPVSLRKRPVVAASSSLILKDQAVRKFKGSKFKGFQPFNRFAPFTPFRPIKKFKRSKVQRFNSFKLKLWIHS